MKTTLNELRDRPHWSFSALNQLLNICSLQFFFQKMEKLTPSHTPVNLVAGSVHHHTLDQVYLGLKLGKPLTIDEALQIYTDDWRSSSKQDPPVKCGKLDAEGIEEQGRGLVRVAMENIDPDEKVLSISEAFCIPIFHDGKFLSKPLVGEFDLVVEKDSKPVVVDWKTSATRWAKDAEKSLQATSYSMAYSQVHGINPEVRFDVAVKNKVPVFEQHTTSRNEDDWSLLGALAAKAEAIVKHGLYYPSLDSFACADCPFADACKTWCAGKYQRKEAGHDIAA